MDGTLGAGISTGDATTVEFVAVVLRRRTADVASYSARHISPALPLLSMLQPVERRRLLALLLSVRWRNRWWPSARRPPIAAAAAAAIIIGGGSSRGCEGEATMRDGDACQFQSSRDCSGCDVDTSRDANCLWGTSDRAQGRGGADSQEPGECG
jgi:hypothetical protein